MATETLIFDPDGDVLFALTRVSRDDPEDGSSSEDVSKSLSADGESHEDEEEENDESQGDVAVPSEPNSVDEVDEVEDMSDDSLALVHCASHQQDTFSQGKEPVTLVHMLVSSKHMMLASPAFKTMFQSDTFQEGRKLRAAGKVEVPLPEDDPTAFEIVLNIIHGRNKRVPRVLSLELLTSVSLLVDKYQMVEAVECFSDTWIGALIEDLPQVYPSKTDSDNVLLWLQVSWVFENNEVFAKMTELLERGCDAYLRIRVDERLLIPKPIFDSILKKRREALSELYDLIEKKIERYQGPKIRCPRRDDTELQRHCDSLILGSLLKSARKLDIIPLPKSKSSPGFISFDELSAKFYSLEINAICDSISRPRIGGAYPKPAHGLKDLIHRKIESLEERLSGLDIQDFKREWKSSRPLVGV